MSILYDDDQAAMAAQTRRVLAARTDKARQLALLDSQGACDEGFWQTAIEQGWTALTVPEGMGGMGLGLVELGLVAQETGRVVAGAPFLAAGHGMVQALLACDDEDLAGPLLRGLASGALRAAIAFAEDVRPLQDAPSVTFRDGRLHGTKAAVPGALGADIVAVTASGPDGPVLALVTVAAAAGDELRMNPVAGFDNGRLHAGLVFGGTPARVLASGDAVAEVALDMLAQMAVVAAHEQVGGAEAAMLAARDYALQRRAFGQPIGAFQSIKHRIAELYGLVEIARANCIHAASRQGEPDFLAAAACARLSAMEAYDTAARDAVQIHGGAGVTWDGGLHLHMRRARSLAIELGNALFWEDLLATELTGIAA